MRRARARRLRRRFSASWPIDVASGRTPAGWRGWPRGEAFAFVLTHDVEGAIGLGRCRALADMEMSLGFRSAFNFVPEGEYEVPSQLRRALTADGFEIGVHDLHHDGKLYRSRTRFRTAAQTINRIVDVFPSHQQPQIRAQLSFVLEGILCQTLLPKANGKGRAMAMEIALRTLTFA